MKTGHKGERGFILLFLSDAPTQFLKFPRRCLFGGAASLIEEQHQLLFKEIGSLILGNVNHLGMKHFLSPLESVFPAALDYYAN
jgi:hypothetical protein